MAKESDIDNEKKVAFAYQLMERKLGALDLAIESVNKKLATLLGFQGVIITLGAGLVFSNQVDGAYLDVFVFGILVMLVSVVLVIKSMFTSEFIDPPYTDVLWNDETLKLSHLDYSNQMVTDMVAAYDSNLPVLNKRGNRLNTTLVVFGIGLVLIAGSLLSYRVWGTNGGSETTQTKQHHRQPNAEERHWWNTV
jgi:hypothetical protein